MSTERGICHGHDELKRLFEILATRKPKFVKGDVTRLSRAGINGGYNLLLDLGCFHSLPEERRDAYARGVADAAGV